MGPRCSEKWARRDSNPPPHGCEPRFASSTVPRLEGKRRPTLLPILGKRLIVCVAGEIADYELNRPFTYLHQMSAGRNPRNTDLRGSDQVRLGAQTKRSAICPIFLVLESGALVLQMLRRRTRDNRPIAISKFEMFFARLHFSRRSQLEGLPAEQGLV